MKTDHERLRGLQAGRAVLAGGVPAPGGCRVFPGIVWLCLVLGAGMPMASWADEAPGKMPAGASSGAGVSHAAEEDAPEDPQARWETLSVRELMQQDLREALRASTAGAGAGTVGRADAGSGVQPVLAPRLVALYGVGQALMAEVQVGRRAYLYVRGQAWPAGHVGDRGVYQLRGMNGACVQLERGEDRHSLCLRMLLGEVRP
ncbi:hypothetical protein ACFO0J_14890 [Castellaniella hirudinis]|uniref:Type IV pilus biogenesis protein PilP n=1 Tax=Castellaniella hirudinis TaxID=1144617 RepID=A0ABV8S104_9BURK